MLDKTNSCESVIHLGNNFIAVTHQPERRPVPSGLSVHSTSTPNGAQRQLHGFCPLDSKVSFQLHIPYPKDVGKTECMAGWLNHQPCFFITGSSKDIAAIQSAPFLQIWTTTNCTEMYFGLEIRESGKELSHWATKLNLRDEAHLDFLLALAEQQVISLLLVPMPMDIDSIAHIVYHPYHSINELIFRNLEEAED